MTTAQMIRRKIEETGSFALLALRVLRYVFTRMPRWRLLPQRQIPWLPLR